MEKAKIKDYITTVTLAAIPVIVAYQAQIGAYIPVEYALIFTLIIGVLSQLTANTRVKEAYQDTSAGIDMAQGTIQKYVNQIEALQAEVDAKQAEIEKVAGLKQMTEQPIMDRGA